MDPMTGRGKTYRNNPRDSTSLAGNYLWRLYMKDGVLYVGTVGDGVSIYNDRTDSFSSYSLEDGLADKNVISIYADKKGFLWTGGWEVGISKMNLSQRKFVPAPEFTNMSSVFSIKSDSLDRLWFSNNDGILIYDEKNDSVTTFSIKDGLPGRSVHGMLDDGKGNYWLSTKNIPERWRWLKKQ